MREEKITYKSTAGQMEEFEKSIIWQDFLLELEDWLEGVHEMLEGSISEEGEALSDKGLHRLGGSAEAIRHFMEMPERIAKNIVDDYKEGELKREEEDAKTTED